ncbi:MAG: hypothetical protein ACI9O4_000599 [Chitinophagales bacterium]|jgi:hypothetical protein
MKNIIYMFVLLFPAMLWSQFIEEFNDSSLTNGPIWLGNLDSFELSNDMLHLNAPAQTSESYLTTAHSGAVDGDWSFRVQLGFNPSSSNRAKVYLLSDQADLKGPLNGYYVMIGNLEDEVSLYKQSGNTSVEIIDGLDDLLNTSVVDVWVKVHRDPLGMFDLYADTSVSFNNWSLQGVSNDNEFLSSSYIGVLCDYTSTRSDKFWFDEFYSSTQVYQDLSAPILTGYTLPNLNTLQLTFNENIDSTSAVDPSNFLLNGTSSPWQLTYNQQGVELYFLQAIGTNTTHHLSLLLDDLWGNSLDTSFTFNVSVSANIDEVRINEIYADETPSFGMPEAEFLELKNLSTDTVHLVDWKIADATDTVQLPAYSLPPNGLLILCKTSAVQSFDVYGEVLGVPNFPSLNNTGDAIKLLNEYLQIIDSVSYTPIFYQGIYDSLGNEKVNGGFSLERLALTSTCGSLYNWFPSMAVEGASPGQENSTQNMSFPPSELQVREVVIENDTTLQVFFTEPLPAFDEQNCTLVGYGIEQAFLYYNQSAYVLLDAPLSLNEYYSFSVQGLVDCWGNLVPAGSFSFYYLDEIAKGDLVINEVLFNPYTGGVDYIEIYNKSEKQIRLEGFSLTEYEVLFPSEEKEGFDIETTVIGPHEYHVFTSDTSNVKLQYNVFEPAWLHENKIPNLPDDEGILVFYFPNGRVMDSLYYRSSWHLSTQDLDDGVSLERINPEQATNLKSNWHSSAKTYGFGTPTAQNSQTLSIEGEGEFKVQPEVFSPNEDGYKDFCMIQYSSDKIGQIANVNIYDVQGRLVRLIAQNHSLGNQNSWKWSGLTNDYQRAPIGIYIVLLELFDEKGKKQVFMKKLVLGTRLN